MTDLQPLSFDVHQAAARLGPAVTVDWLKKRASAGEIPCTRSGKGSGRAGRLAFTEAHLVEILQIIERRPEAEDGEAPTEDGFTSVVSRGRRSA